MLQIPWVRSFRASLAPTCLSVRLCISVPLQMQRYTWQDTHQHTNLQTLAEHTNIHTQRYLNTQQPATKKPKITGTCCSNHNEPKLERFLGNSNFKHKPQQWPKKQHANNAALEIAVKQLAHHAHTTPFYVSCVYSFKLNDVLWKTTKTPRLFVSKTLTIRS